MRTYLKFLYVSLLLILVGAFALNNSQASADMRTVTVTEKDNNSTVELNRGDLLEVILEFSPGTGYSWQIAKNDANLLEPQGEPTISGGTEQKNMPGAAEQATFRFRALKSGTTVIALQHKRPWEKEKEPHKVFSITVNIK
jgi:predicted secreted protein